MPSGSGFRRLPDDGAPGVTIEFDGVYQNSEVWVNGHHLGSRPYGYISFYYDLTPHLVDGENVVAVRVDNSHQPNTRWYSGSGIYRHSSGTGVDYYWSFLDISTFLLLFCG